MQSAALAAGCDNAIRPTGNPEPGATALVSKPTIVFDLDGTLADTARDLVAVLNRVIEPHGLLPVERANIGHVAGQGAKAMIERAFVLQDRSIDVETHNHLFDLFLADYGETLADHTVLYPGALDCMEEFARDGWLLTVCTNKMESMARKLLEVLEVSDRFAAISGGDTFEFRKPDPRHIEKTIEAAGGDPGHSVMIGDSINDIAAAHAAGVVSVAVSFGYADRPVEELAADMVIHSFDELRPAALHAMLDRRQFPIPERSR